MLGFYLPSFEIRECSDILQEEYKRKNEKILKLQAKKKAEVLAITRGDEDSDDDVEFVDDVGEAIKGKVVTPISTSKLVETAQEVSVMG